MFGINPIKVVISGVDQFTSVFGNVRKEAKKVAQEIDQVGRGLTKVGLTLTGIGLGLAHATGLTDIPKLAIDSEHALRNLGNVGELTGKQLAQVGKQMNSMTVATNQAQPDLLEATKTLVAAGIDLKDAMGFLPTIGKAATAEQADIVDLSRVMISAYDNMGVSVNKLGYSLDIMTKASKIGRFELADMAREFPALTASAAYLGIKGPEGIAKMSAALQVAVKGAANPKEAATNFSNFLNKITSQETMNNFMKIPGNPINLVKKLQPMLGKGHDPILEMVQLVNSVITAPSRGKAPNQAEQVARTTFLFKDQQILGFIKAMVPKLELYKQIRDKSLQADGEVTNDYKSMMTTLAERWKAFKIQLAATLLPKLAEPLKKVSDILANILGNQKAIAIIAKTIIALVAVGGVLTTLGIVAGAVSAIIGLVCSTAFLVALGIGAAIAALVLFFKNWDRGWVKALTVLISVFFPMFGIVMILMKHWSKVLPFFKLLWIGIVAVFKIAFVVLGAIMKPFMFILKEVFNIVENVIEGVFDLINLIMKVTLPAWLQKKIGLDASFTTQAGQGPNPSTFGKFLEQKKDKVDVNVNFKNMPQGTEVNSKGTKGVNFDMTRLGLSFGS